jgi:FkbM family methyltransferase
VGVKQRLRRLADRTLLGFGRVTHQPLPTRFNGAWLALPQGAWRSVHDTYEPATAAALRAHLKPGSVFFDVGAHAGLWSAFAAHLTGPTGHVHAFEPSAAFEILERTARAYPSIAPVRAAVGAEDGELDFFGQGASTSGSLVRSVTILNERHHAGVPVGHIKTAVRSLDSFVASARVRPDVIKVDVEGFELQVLRGSMSLLRAIRPVWLIEVHPPQLTLSGGTTDELFARLREAGYSIDVVDRSPNSLYTILAT